jgi:flagellar biosynthetic protein FliQ
MDTPETLDIAREALWVLIKISLPVMMVALVVGLIIALFQALTQIQEATLTFVPKIVAMFFALLIFLPFMYRTLQLLNEHLYEQIIGIG